MAKDVVGYEIKGSEMQFVPRRGGGREKGSVLPGFAAGGLLGGILGGDDD